MFGKLFNKEKPNYGLLEEFINKPNIGQTSNINAYNRNPEHFNDQAFYTKENPFPQYKARGIYQVPTNDGNRYYFGQDQAGERDMAQEFSMDDAYRRSQMYPADSLTTEQVNRFKGHNLFPKK